MVAALATVVALAVVATGCGSAEKAASNPDGAGAASGDTVSRANKGIVQAEGEKPKPGGKIVYGLAGESNGWNPSTNQWAASGLQVSRAIFDTLSAYDESSKIHPNLAERFDHNADYTEWVIKLRPGVKLSNGKPVNAEVVARNQSYLKKSPVTGGAYTYVRSFEPMDDLSVKVTLDQPWVTYPMSLATQIGVVADPDWLESNDGLEPIGSGPFTLDTWEIGNKLVVRRNPSYWQKDPDGLAYPYLDSIEFRVITDQDSRSAALKAGDVDMIESFNGFQVQEFQKLDGFQVYSDAKGEVAETFVQLNTMVAPLDDPDARQALAYATDKKQVIEIMTGGYTEPANGPFSPASPFYEKTDYPQYDQAKARELVERVKARHGGEFTFTVVGSAEPTTQKLEQLLQQQWADVGIDAKLLTQEQAALIINVVTGNYQATTWRQFDAPNPTIDGVWFEPVLAVPPPTFSLNFARNKDEAIGKALEVARGTDDPALFKQQIATLQQRLAADVPYVWLYHEQIAIIGASRLVDMTNYRLPDGAVGLDLNQGAHALHQMWLRSS